jgi:hypothetical protein
MLATGCFCLDLYHMTHLCARNVGRVGHAAVLFDVFDDGLDVDWTVSVDAKWEKPG